VTIEEKKSTSAVRHISKYVGILSGSVAAAGIGFGRACQDGAKAAGKLFVRSKNEEDEDGSQPAETAVVEPAEAVEPEAPEAPESAPPEVEEPEPEPASAEKPEEEPEPAPKSGSKAKAKKTEKPVKEVEKEAAPSL
jgi:outer membrane biosynthesis protein TonB